MNSLIITRLVVHNCSRMDSTFLSEVVTNCSNCCPKLFDKVYMHLAVRAEGNLYLSTCIVFTLFYKCSFAHTHVQTKKCNATAVRYLYFSDFSLLRDFIIKSIGEKRGLKCLFGFKRILVHRQLSFEGVHLIIISSSTDCI